MEPATAETTRTAYRIKVHNLETCNCEHGCGCQFGGFPDHGGCEFIIGYEVIEGNYGEVDLAGTRLVIGAKYPKAIHEGGGRAVLFVDENASAEQVEGVAMIFSGQAGGMPWEAIADTLDAVEGPVVKPIEMTVDGRRSSYRIPDVLDVEMAPIINPVTGEENDVHIVYPQGGFFWNDGSVGTTETMRIDYGDIHLDHPGQFASYAVAEWTNQA